MAEPLIFSGKLTVSFRGQVMGGLYCGFFRGDTAPWMRVSKQPILRCAFFVMFYYNENFIISVSCLEKIGSKSLEQTGKNTVYISSLNIRLSADRSFWKPPWEVGWHKRISFVLSWKVCFVCKGDVKTVRPIWGLKIFKSTINHIK